MGEQANLQTDALALMDFEAGQRTQGSFGIDRQRRRAG